MGSKGKSHRMLDFVERDSLSRMVSEPMRDDNIFDLVLVTQENLVDNVSVGEHLGSSDHILVRLELKQGLQRIKSWFQSFKDRILNE